MDMRRYFAAGYDLFEAGGYDIMLSSDTADSRVIIDQLELLVHARV